MLAIPGITLSPLHSAAAGLKFNSDTLVRGYERDKSTQKAISVVPVYQYLEVDYGALHETGFSLHANGWGRTDLGNRDFFTDNETGELLYGYLEYTTNISSLSTRLGRQYVFEGPASESIDGIRIQGEAAAFAFSGFAGLSVALQEDNGSSGDMAYGGSLRHNWQNFNKLGLSYKHVDSNSSRDEESAGIDIYLALPKNIDLTALSTRNLITDDWGEHFIEARFALYQLDIRPYFQKYQYEDYFSTTTNSANPFRYLAGTNEELTLYATDLSKANDSGWNYGSRIKYYDYSIRDDNSFYLSGLATWLGEELTQVGLEVGLMDGDTPESKYYIIRLNSYWDQIARAEDADLPRFVSADLVFVSYDTPIHNEDASLFISLGTGWRFREDAFEFKISVDYSSDPFFDSDLRGMMLLTYKLRRGEGQ